MAEYGSYDRLRGSAVVSGPLVGDELAVRVAVDYWQRDNYIDHNGPRYSAGDH